MKLKRILTGIIGLPIVALILMFGNIYIIDTLFCIVSIIAIHEFLKAFNKQSKPLKILSYLTCLIILFLHIIPKEYLGFTLAITVACIIAISFIKIIITNMKTKLSDVMVTFFGIGYIVFFLSFLPLLYGSDNGKYLIWYVLIAAWGTDTCAYFVGSKFGRNKLSKISPKKSIEGAIGGIVGAIIISFIYTICINNFAGLNISYLYIIPISTLLSVLSQLGDVSASAIKRTVEIKDFGNLIPGHGGILDRIDSIIFIAPFAYFLLTMI